MEVKLEYDPFVNCRQLMTPEGNRVFEGTYRPPSIDIRVTTKIPGDDVYEGFIWDAIDESIAFGLVGVFTTPGGVNCYVEVKSIDDLFAKSNMLYEVSSTSSRVFEGKYYPSLMNIRCIADGELAPEDVWNELNESVRVTHSTIFTISGLESSPKKEYRVEIEFTQKHNVPITAHHLHEAKGDGG